jgi:putative ABC transport system permease protein
MLKHLFKLIWNKKGQNFLFLSEILVSFLVIFSLFSFLTFYYQNYRTPLGFKYEQVLAVSYDNSQLTRNSDSLDIIYSNLRNSLKAMPQIEEVSYAGNNFPYSNSMSGTGITQNGKKFERVLNFIVDDHNLKVWDMKLMSGRWFTPEDAVAKNKPILLNETLARDIFGTESAVGKYIGDYDNKEKLKVIGVVQDIKTSGDYWPAGRAIFNRLDTGFLKHTSTILVKVRPNTGAAFESQLYKFMASSFREANIEISHLDEMRDDKNEVTVIPMIIFIIIAIFLIINVALGLFGVLW